MDMRKTKTGRQRRECPAMMIPQLSCLVGQLLDRGFLIPQQKNSSCTSVVRFIKELLDLSQ